MEENNSIREDSNIEGLKIHIGPQVNIPDETTNVSNHTSYSCCNYTREVNINITKKPIQSNYCASKILVHSILNG